MGKIIAVANQKGGVGKTTTSVNISACFAMEDKKVLLIDMDPQGNATSGVGVSKENLEESIYSVIIDDKDLKECIKETCIEKLTVVPSNIALAGAEIELISVDDREYILKKALEKIKNEYDFIVIDCPPSLGLITLNALCAADSILIPIQCEYYALEGVGQLMNTISLVQKRLNPNLDIEGVVLTMFDARTNLSCEVVSEVKNHFKGKVYSTIVPRNVRLSEAPSHGLPIVLYDKSSKGAECYIDLAQEIIENN